MSFEDKSQKYLTICDKLSFHFFILSGVERHAESVIFTVKRKSVKKQNKNKQTNKTELQLVNMTRVVNVKIQWDNLQLDNGRIKSKV